MVKYLGTMRAVDETGDEIIKRIEGTADEKPSDRRFKAGNWLIEISWQPQNGGEAGLKETEF